MLVYLFQPLCEARQDACAVVRGIVSMQGPALPYIQPRWAHSTSTICSYFGKDAIVSSDLVAIAGCPNSIHSGFVSLTVALLGRRRTGQTCSSVLSKLTYRRVDIGLEYLRLVQFLVPVCRNPYLAEWALFGQDDL